jgi:hypothetical protein
MILVDPLTVYFLNYILCFPLLFSIAKIPRTFRYFIDITLHIYTLVFETTVLVVIHLEKRSTNMMNRARGIALIDLLVLVALISILAAIFIPQFAAYAVRTQNAAAISDLRGAIAAEQALYVDYGGYGFQYSVNASGMGNTGAGSELFGPLSPATPTAHGRRFDHGACRGRRQSRWSVSVLPCHRAWHSVPIQSILHRR